MKNNKGKKAGKNVKEAPANNKKPALIMISAVLVIAVIAVCWLLAGGERSTVEIREAQIAEMMPGTTWDIVSECEIDGYIVSGAKGENGKDVIVSFKPIIGGTYETQTATIRDSGDVVIGMAISRDGLYDVVWCDNEALVSVELTYKVNGEITEQLKFDSSGRKVIANPAPEGDYMLDVVYYDAEGNSYE